MAKRETEPNGSRKLIDYLNGEGPFSEKLVLEVTQLKLAYGHLANGMQGMSTRLDKAERQAGDNLATVLGAVAGVKKIVEKKQEKAEVEHWEDDGEDTDVTSDRDVLRRKAKGQRAKAVKMRRIAAWLAGPVAFLGALLWELLRSYGPTMPPRHRGQDMPAQMGPGSPR